MKRIAIVFFNIACIISCIVGMLHFSVPTSFDWYSYIPDAPSEIYQSINYINFCFSFLLSGLSIILLMMQKQFFAHLNEATLVYLFFVLVWLSRAIIQIVWPWPSRLQLWLVIGFSTQFILTLIPMLFVIQNKYKLSQRKIGESQ